ncbi:MAG: phosphohydrolase [Desulfobacteraceae bacterium 4572_123]|nr:MAG: phosphohydrolase [Desulfobacteraceae bacterium 4572_123]
MAFNMLNIIFSFSVFSILGWFLEVSYRSLRERRFLNPGLLKGPYLILYGTGSLVLMGCISLFNFYDAGFAAKVLVYFTTTTGLELISGFIGYGLFNIRLWDYSDQPFQYKGHICLKFSVYWVLLAFGFEYLILPSYQSIFDPISPAFKMLFSEGLILIMAIDFAGKSLKNFISPNTPKEKIITETEFMNAARPLLENPALKALSQLNHHRGKTRLEHVKEVAYLSFLWGRRLSLDCNAIVRAGLLHDLFYYDWLHGGPRLHGFKHPNIALKNARKVTCLSKKEEDIIKKHMWPLTIIPPVYMESLIVSLIDTFCSTRDYISFRKYERSGKSIALLDNLESGEKKDEKQYR